MESRPWLSWAVLLLLLVVALALRWRYIREISLFVDEFVTAWAAQNVLSRGLPIFPSGNFYPHGFVFTYLVAPFLLGEFNEVLVRLPALLVSLATIPVAYWIGRRFFSEPVGLLTAAAMAVDPDCIVWGGRARMYGLLQLLTLLVVYFYYRGLAGPRPATRVRDRFLAMGLLVVAIFTHAEAAFLLPVLGLATLVVLPWRRILRPTVILPFVLGAGGALAFFLLSYFGQPGHLVTLEQEGRGYLDLTADILSGPQAFAPVFGSLHRLPFTILAIIGLYFLFRPRIEREAPLTYLYVVLVSFIGLLVMLAGTTWQRDRYLFLVLPLLFLIGGEVLTRLIGLVPTFRGSRPPEDWPLRQQRPWQPALLSLLVALWVGLTGAPTAYVQEWGYDRAFRSLREGQVAAGDRIVTSMSTAAELYLGRNDAFAIQQGYEEYVVAGPGNGEPVDLWTATPIITSTAAFVDLLSTAPRVWFVTDGWRFQTRYQPDWILTVLQQMDLVYNDRGALVFRGEGYQAEPEPAFRRERRADFGREMALTGFGLSPLELAPGDELAVSLYWQALEEAGPAYTAFLHLVDANDSGVAGVDEPLLQGLYQPDLWPKDRVVPDRHRLTLPENLPPGRYRLDLGLYPTGQPEALLPVQEGDRLPLATLTVGQVGEPPPTIPTQVDFGGQFRLLGFDLDCNPEAPACSLQLHWQALAGPDRDYTVLVHLLDAGGTIIAQDDRRPGDPFFPTSTWLPGDVVRDRHLLAAPDDAPPGEYTILVGLYYRPTAERLPAVDADGKPLGDALPLIAVQIGRESP